MSQSALNLDDAATQASQLFSASSADNDDTRGSGLILTKDQLKDLKRYEIAGLALPIELEDVMAYLGYRNGAGTGLEPEDFQKTFKLVHAHASLWNPLRTDLLTVNDKLVLFSGSIQTYGESMSEVFDDIEALGLVEKYNISTLEDLKRVEMELGQEFPGIKQTDRADIGSFLNDILEKVREQEALANGIKDRLDAFGFDLANKITPEIQSRLKQIDDNTLDAEIKALQTGIDNRALTIEEKNKEYKKLVGDAIAGISSGLIMVIYASVQAEKVRKERNELKKQQQADIAQMSHKNKVLASLARVRMDIQDLEVIAIDADIATKNLITVWNKLAGFIVASSREVEGINDGLNMRRFRNRFNLVVGPWRTIEKDAKALLRVFAQADAEFRAEYGDQK
ncbi:alpha-xenorhabdolysin family binary toxin subunit A [Pseudomonas abietaniphila]